MRPALYYPWIYLKGGAERSILELMRRSRHSWTLYTNHFDRDATFPEFADLPVVSMSGISVRRSIPEVARAVVRILGQKMAVGGHDSLTVVSEGLGNFFALRTQLPTSCVCLTPLKVVYDDVTRARFFNQRLRLHYRAAFWLYKQVERPVWRRYQRVFCNSEEVRGRLLRARLVDPERLEVAYHGVDLERFQPGGSDLGYLLAPGRIMWQKNLELVIDAWRQFKPTPTTGPLRLLIAGMADAKSAPYLAGLRARAAGRSDIEFITSPTDSEMVALYQGSRGVVFGAPNEDWGLVPLEAMACGRAVLAVDRGGPRESIIEGRTGYLRPGTPGAFAAGMKLLASHVGTERERFSQAGRARAQEFPWNRFVNRLDDYTEEAARAGELVRDRVSAR